MYLTFISSLPSYFSCTLGQLLISAPGALQKTPAWLPRLWFCVANSSSTTCPPVGTLSSSYCLGISLLKDQYSPSTVWIRSGRCPGWHPVSLRSARWTCLMLSCLSASFTHVCNPVLPPHLSNSSFLPNLILWQTTPSLQGFLPLPNLATFSVTYCISDLLRCNRFLHNLKQQTSVISHYFRGSSIWERLR